MRRSLFGFLATGLSLALIFTCTSNVRSDAAGFVPLFNGKNLDGWVNVNCAPETFTVSDGNVVCTGIPSGVLRTARMYENYVLELEWRHMKKGGNAGLFVHSGEVSAPGSPFTRAIEVQVMDGNGGDVFAILGAQMRPDKPHPEWPGAMRSLPAEDRMNPTGQWNHYRVTCLDGTISLAVNGEVVTRGYHCNPRKGYICLESEGSEIHFRSIRIKELPSSSPPPDVVAMQDRGFRSIFNGVDLRGWKKVPGNEGHWVAKDGKLNYDGKSEADGQDNQSLTTEKEYGNFKLILDWRMTAEPEIKDWMVLMPDGTYLQDEQGNDVMVKVPNAGDSGIYLRGSSKTQVNIWNLPCGSGEIWGYRTDKEMPEEVRRSVVPMFNADNPPGEWNRFEITLIDEVVTIDVNGKTVIRDARLPGIPDKGSLVLQHHGDPMQFANIYIKELP
jgi:3-keto-disaccharide hydrolase